MSKPSCAILFGMPTSHADFFAAADGAWCHDYMATTLRRRPAEQVWAERYEQIAEAAESLIRTARRWGAAVSRRATLHSVRELSAEHDTLVIAAHWKGDAIADRDLPQDLDALAQGVADARHPAADMLRAAIERALRPPSADTSRSIRVVDELNRLIESGDLLTCLPAPIRMAFVPQSSLARAVCRDFVDEALGPLITPGNRFELFDGLHSSGAVEAALASTFRGDIELATCESDVFATYLRHRRRDGVLVIQHKEILDPLPRYWLVEVALEQALTREQPYRVVRLALEAHLLKELRRHWLTWSRP